MVTHILLKSYSLSTDPAQAKMVVVLFPKITNEFDMTIKYLIDWVRRMYVDHPKAKSEVEKYIRITKQLHARGYITNELYIKELFEIIEGRFLVNPNSIT